ncbi:MAG: esterase family protein [Planctomycetes bacterium]|nr:esterase family protein [Planctomycetota bacterium]
MSLLNVSFFSQSLQMQSAMNVILPDVGDGPFPVYYLLHGLSDSYSIWCRRTSIERYVARLPLIVVMPDGGRGWYTNAEQGFAYEDLVMKDVIGYVEKFFPARTGSDRARVIGGLSMGGYGALKLGFKHPRRFSGIAGHSGAYSYGHSAPGPERSKETARIFGALPNPDEDVFALAEKNRALIPPLRFDCGTEDALLQHNRSLHARLQQLGVSHEYHEFPGAHEWGYWDCRVQEALVFLAAALGIEPISG